MATDEVAYGATNKYLDELITIRRMTAVRQLLFPLFCKVNSTPSKQKRVIHRRAYAYAEAFSGSAPTAETVGVSNHTLTVAESNFAKDLAVPWRDKKLDPNELAQTMVDLVDLVIRHMESLPAAALEAALTTGGSALKVYNGDGTLIPFYDAAVADGGSGGHVLNDGSSTKQINKVATALSAQSLGAARAIITRWLDNAGKPLGLEGVPLGLIVPPELREIAVALTGSGAIDITTTQVGGSSGAVTRAPVNPLAGIIPIVHPYLSDGSNWHLCPLGDYSPFTAWFETPDYNIFDQERDRATYVGATYQARVFVEAPTHTTAVGSSQ